MEKRVKGGEEGGEKRAEGGEKRGQKEGERAKGGEKAEEREEERADEGRREGGFSEWSACVAKAEEEKFHRNKDALFDIKNFFLSYLCSILKVPLRI